MNYQFQENLKNLKIKNNLTQDELADIINVSRQAISKWERGEGLPDLHNLQLLSKALKVSVDELIGNEKIKPDSHTHYHHNTKNNGFEKTTSSAGNYFKKLIYKANHATNSDQAKEIRKKLLTYGGIGLAVGIILIFAGFISFAVGGQRAVSNFNMSYNPIGSIIIFMLGGLITSISGYVVYAWLSIVIAGVTTKFLDEAKHCPNCNDKVDSDEKICSNCGTRLINVCSCGKVNQLGDIYCRECGKKLD